MDYDNATNHDLTSRKGVANATSETRIIIRTLDSQECRAECDCIIKIQKENILDK